MSSKLEAGTVTEGGSTVFRHGPESAWAMPEGEESIEEISAHITTHLGPIRSVFHEIVSDTVHIDVHWVEPTAAVPFIRLVTSGMSDLPMSMPPDCDAPRYLELMVTLPADWQLDEASLRDERWYWPVRWLKILARLPHKHQTWLGWGHSIPNGDPPEPYAANTKLCCALILPPIAVPDGFRSLRLRDDKEIHFMSVVPIHAAEMSLKLLKGTDALTERFDRHGISELIDPARRDVARKRFFFF
jgi:hypothetical protein